MESAVDRHVFYISDGTAITAEVLGHAVMSQFPVAISSVTLPFVGNLIKYDARIAAIDYTLAHDDGISLRNLDQAQVILLGVSRCGKTPTSLYLAMQYGIRAANYPFIADDMDNLVLPASLKPLQHKMFGLTINPERLAAIREERRENSRYASLRQCRMRHFRRGRNRFLRPQ